MLFSYIFTRVPATSKHNHIDDDDGDGGFCWGLSAVKSTS